MANFKQETLYSSKILRDSIHFPFVKGTEERNGTSRQVTIPLYKYADNVSQVELGDDTDALRITAFPEYRSNINAKYNSPKNVKKLFISGSKVYVQYHIPVPGCNTTFHSGELVTSTGKNLFEVAANKVKVLKAGSGAVPVGDNTPIDYRLEASMFKAIFNTWVFSNIEEVYWDWTALIDNGLALDLLPNVHDILDLFEFAKNTRNLPEPVYKESAELKGEIIKLNKGNSASIRDRYPRLRVAAIIANLDDLLRTSDFNPGVRQYKGNEAWNGDIKEAYKKLTKTWLDTNINKCSYVIAARFEGSLESYNVGVSGFELDSSLKAFFEEEIAQLKSARIKSSLKDAGYETDDNETNSPDAVVNDVEAKLLEYKEKLDDSHFKLLLQIFYKTHGIGDVKQLFGQISPNNRKEWSAILGLQL